jgi:hypothetical protein
MNTAAAAMPIAADGTTGMPASSISNETMIAPSTATCPCARLSTPASP